MSKEKWKAYLNKKAPHKTEWVLVILAGMILGSLYLYNDIAFTSSCGVKFWNCLFSGKLPIFYWEGYQGAEGSILESSMGGSYDFALYFMFALYNFPTWIWEKITGFSFMQFIASREYIKGIVWVFSGICAYLIYKLAEVCDVEKEEAKWGALLFLSSAIFFYTEVIMSGYDVISASFTLLGIYGYLKKNNKCFVISFSLAIAMKMFAVWIFIPLVLLKEKRIWRILVYGVEGLAALVVPKIYFAVASHRYLVNQAIEYTVATGGQAEEVQAANYGNASNGIIDHAEAVVNDALFPTGKEAEYTFLTMDTLPLVFVGMFALWLFCYFYKKEMTKRQIIYICAVAMSTFILTVKLHPQWSIILVPYLLLIIMFHPERMKENLILEGVFSLGFVLNKAIFYKWTCNLNLIEYMTMPQHTFSYALEEGGSAYGFSHYVARLGEKIGISEDNFAFLFKAAVVVGLIMFLIWNYPGRAKEDVDFKVDFAKRRQWLLVRFGISCLVGMLPMVGLIQYLA